MPQVRLISDSGEQLGLVNVEDALKRAQAEELDLVEISPTAVPPVCKLMDFGKYKYQVQKKEHDQKRKTHGMELKQIRIKSFLIDPHDVEIKLKQARTFVEEGHRVVFTMMFRARENQHADLGETLLNEKFAKGLADVSKVDSPPAKDGRKMTMSLSPLPNLKAILTQRTRAAQAAQKAALAESARLQASAAAEAAAPAIEAPASGETAPAAPAPTEPAGSA